MNLNFKNYILLLIVCLTSEEIFAQSEVNSSDSK